MIAEDKIILFTHADKFQQDQLNVTYKDLERSMKNTVLLFGKTTLPGSSVLKSEMTYELLLDAKELLKQGIIIPDLRAEYNSFGSYLEKNKKLFKNYSDIQKRADFLDRNSKNVIRFNSNEISNSLETNIISSLFYLKLNGDLNITWNNLSDFIDFIKKPGISERQSFLIHLNRVAKPNQLILSSTQAIYHTLGALVTNSHPIWPQLYSNTFEKIRIAQTNSNEKISKSKEALKIANKHKEINLIQELNKENNKKIHLEELKQLNEFSFLSDETLDALDWNDIIDLSKKKSL